MLSRFVTAGHDVAIAAPDPASDVARTYEHEGVRVYRYPIPSSPTRAECQGDPVRGADLFHRWLEAERPDVVHVHTFVTGLGLHEVRAAKAAGARVIVTTHSSSLGYLCQRGTLMRWGEQVCDGVCEVEKCAACALHARGLSKAAAEAVASMPVEVSRALARVLLEKNPTVLRGAKIAVKRIRYMDWEVSADYLYAKFSEAMHLGANQNRKDAIKAFLDDKQYRPGLETFKGGKPARRRKSKSGS